MKCHFVLCEWEFIWPGKCVRMLFFVIRSIYATLAPSVKQAQKWKRVPSRRENRINCTPREKRRKQQREKIWKIFRIRNAQQGTPNEVLRALVGWWGRFSCQLQEWQTACTNVYRHSGHSWCEGAGRCAAAFRIVTVFDRTTGKRDVQEFSISGDLNALFLHCRRCAKN